MSTWGRRLKYYGIGFGIGLIFVFFFFKNRGCSWLPENRVKNSILDRLVVVSDETATKLESKGIDHEELIQVLNDGDVVFSESKKEGDSKVYVIERNDVKYCFTLPYESFFSEIKIGEDAKKTETSTEGWGEIVHFPTDSTLIWPDSTKLMTCQQDKLGLISSKEILKLVKATGKVDFGKTDLTIRPKPEHYLFFEKDGEEIGAKVIWYKNKLNVISFEGGVANDCK